MRCLLFALLLLACAPASSHADSNGVSDEWIMRLIHRHCAMCHAENPSHTTLLGQVAPKGVVLESVEDVRRFGPKIEEMVVVKKFMPFANETAMSDADRERFGQWLAGQ
jgi:uncharacterized membrane protein